MPLSVVVVAVYILKQKITLSNVGKINSFLSDFEVRMDINRSQVLPFSSVDVITAAADIQRLLAYIHLNLDFQRLHIK